MPFRYLEDFAPADVAFEAEGGMVGELFQEAAAAVANVMVRNQAAIDQKVTRLFEMEAPSSENLLYHFLQEIIFLKDSERLFFKHCSIEIDGEGPSWHIHAHASGETIDQGRQELLSDGKAVSHQDFRVRQTCGG